MTDYFQVCVIGWLLALTFIPVSFLVMVKFIRSPVGTRIMMAVAKVRARKTAKIMHKAHIDPRKIKMNQKIEVIRTKGGKRVE